MSRSWVKQTIVLIFLAAVVAVGSYLWTKKRRPPAGAFTLVATRLNELSTDSCDLASQQKRLGLSQVIDRYREDIHGLWQARKTDDFPEFKMIQVGPIFLRLNKSREGYKGFDTSTWSWEEAFGLYLRTQRDASAPETPQRWRDLDTMVRFLLEKDVGRILKGRQYLPPESTQHTFRPGPSVRRIGRKAFEVTLHPGDFSGAESKLTELFEKEWNSLGYGIKLKWTKDPSAYRVKAHFQSGRSYVNHREKVLVISNFSWVRTVAHELGHVLGFDDHYYSVWNGRNCYYTQEARLSDLMSSSEQGGVTNRHWELMDEAYPWKGTPKTQPFFYLW